MARSIFVGFIRLVARIIKVDSKFLLAFISRLPPPFIRSNFSRPPDFREAF